MHIITQMTQHDDCNKAFVRKAEFCPYRRGTGRKNIVAGSGLLKVWSHLQNQKGYLAVILLCTQCIHVSHTSAQIMHQEMQANNQKTQQT